MTFHPDSFPPPRGETDAELPSKSQRKREMRALQDLGAQLATLSSEQFKKMDLPEALAAALADAQRFAGRREALRRQMQYVGKLMRAVDPEPIRAQLDALRGVAASEIARQHRLERLRDDLLADEKTIEAIVRDFPRANIQHLRTLRRNAIKEREQQKPPRACRELFRALRELDDEGKD